MDTRTYLDQLKNIDKRIKNKISEAEKWRDIALSTKGGALDDVKVQETLNPDKMGSAIAMAVDYERESERLAEELTALKARIIEQIDGMDDPLHYNILYWLYVENKRFVEVAVMVDYSYKQTKRHYNNALDAFEAKYGKEYLDKKRVA